MDREFRVGRETGDYILSGDMALSRRHFRIQIFKSNGILYRFIAEDLESLNGTTFEWNEIDGKSPVKTQEIVESHNNNGQFL